MSNSNATMKTVANISQYLTCYVAAPSNTDLKALEKLLLEKQIQLIVSADVSSEAVTFLGGIANAIATADLFIAVLSPEQNNEIVYLELGIAIASQRRILLIAPPDRPLMVDIAELPAVRADITNHEAISLMVDQVLLAPPRKFRPQLPMPATQKGQPIGDLADELQKRLNNAIDERGREFEMMTLVSEALEKSGYAPIANASLGDGKTGDFVVWSDEFGPWIGNALIIEIKRMITGRTHLRKVVDQVSEYLQVSQIRSALVLYDKAAGKDFSLSISPPNIFFLDIYQLFSAMRTKSFAQVMIDLRNRRVHGIDSV